MVDRATRTRRSGRDVRRVSGAARGGHVRRRIVQETTALGAAYLAGLAVGFWKDRQDIAANWALEREFSPEAENTEIEGRYADWKRAVDRSRDWVQSQ